MSSVENALFEALEALNAAAQSPRERKWDFQELFERIDDLAERLPFEGNAPLLHYVQRRSYEKARLWLAAKRREGGVPNPEQTVE